MKNMTISATLFVSLFLAASAAAQEATLETSKENAEAEAARQQQQKLELKERAEALMKKKPVTLGGFLVDAARAEKKTALFSLRRPRDPKNDVKNISFHERTGQPRGFVLFRLEF